jgi:hypothetical protein
MTDAALAGLRDLIQEDIGGRGLGTDPAGNLLTACSGDFAAACRSVANSARPALAVVTGFFIPHGQPPCGETDGPLGAIFLARALVPLGIKVVLAIDAFGTHALQVGLAECGLEKQIPVITLPSFGLATSLTPEAYRRAFFTRAGSLSHLVALERVGPSHALASLQAQLGPHGAVGETYLDFLHDAPQEEQDRCHSMRGRDITDQTSPAHYLFEQKGPVTIGIGDGGNEIGMGKVGWDVIRRNIPRGGLVACRVPTDHLIVCGISNWGAYGLAAGVRRLRGLPPGGELFDPDVDRRILQAMVERGPLVDGVTGGQTATVDGINFDRYGEKLLAIGKV